MFSVRNINLKLKNVKFKLKIDFLIYKKTIYTIGTGTAQCQKFTFQIQNAHKNFSFTVVIDAPPQTLETLLGKVKAHLF